MRLRGRVIGSHLRGDRSLVGAYLDYDIIPIVDMAKAVELQKKAIAFRKG